MNLYSLKLSEKTSLLLRREHQSFEDGCCITFCAVASINPSKMDAAPPTAASPPGKLRGSDCSGSTGTAFTPVGGAPDCMIFTSPDSILERDTRPKDQGLKKDFGDTTVQDCSTPQQLARRGAWGRTVLQLRAPGMGPWLQYFDMGGVHHGRKLPPGESASEEPRVS